MQAVTRSRYGPPELLSIKEVEKPTPNANEVLIRVYATTVNRTDCSILWGKPFIKYGFVVTGQKTGNVIITWED